MPSSLFMAIDLGTTNIKVAIFAPNGDLQALAEEKGPGGSHNSCEFNPSYLWKVTTAAVAKLPIVLKKNVVALSIVGQGPTIIPMYSDGEVAYNAVTWLDRHGAEYVKSLLQMGIDMQSAVIFSKLIWLKDKIKKPAYILEPADYICMKLTGKIVNMSFDVPGFRPPWYERSLMTKLRLRNHFMVPELVPTGHKVANLLPNIAHDLDLPLNVSVIAGAKDFAAALVGTETLEDGYLCDRGGTSEGINLCSKRKINCEGLLTTPFIIDSYWKLSGLMNTTGKAIDWFCSSVSPCSSLLAQISEMPSRVKRPTNIVFLPYLKGERSPYWNADAKGLFFGLDLETDKSKLLVSIMEGVAFGIQDIIQRMEAKGAIIRKVRVTGGPARNRLWNQIKADVLNKQIEVPSVIESELLGAAIFAMSYSYKEDLLKTAKRTVKIVSVVHPNPQIHSRYKRLFAVYQALYHRNEDLFSTLTELSSNCIG